AHCAYISIALLSAERLRGPPCSTETEFAANPEAIAMSGSDMDLWTTVTPQLPTRNSEEPIRRGPFTVELVGHVPFVGLVTAVIAQEDDVFETVQFETPGGIFEDQFKRGFGHAYRSGETHVTRGRAQTALRDVRDHGSDKRVTQRNCDPLRKQLDAPIVFSERHSRAALLGSADRNDYG